MFSALLFFSFGLVDEAELMPDSRTGQSKQCTLPHETTSGIRASVETVDYIAEQ